MQFSTSALAALGFAAISSAHIIMTSPVPYGKSSLNNSPLAADGSDYPCKLRGTTFSMEDPSNEMAVGSSQNLAFQGTAVHGGGSCQVSIAMLPSGKTLSTLTDSDAKNLKFKVIHSIQGSCPYEDITGNVEYYGADAASHPINNTYAFTIPASVPAGNATLAWTWFNKVGNREMYMNCAPVTITSGTSKRDENLEARDTSAFSALPDMFTANIGNSCGTVDSMDVIFPQPGGSFTNIGAQFSPSAAAAPTGAGCQAKVAATGGSSSPTSAAASGGGSVATTSAASVAPTSVAASFPTTSAGGVFVTTFAPVAASTTKASAAASTTLAASPSAATTSAVASAAASGNATTSGTGTTIAAGTACTTEGMFNCISGGKSYQECASGTWSVVMPLADGTSCTVGDTMDINIVASKSGKKARDLKKFPREHLRRHLHRSV